MEWFRDFMEGEYVAKDKRKLREGGGWCDQSVYIPLRCFQRTNEFKTLKKIRMKF